MTAPAAPRADVERLIVVARRVEDGCYLFARWADWPYPAMLSTLPPGDHETLSAAIDALLHGRMRVHVASEPRLATDRVPVRMPRPRGGGPALGWLHPVAAEVAGEPLADGLIAGVEALSLDDALRALPTDVERAVLRAAAAAFPPPGAAEPRGA